MKNGWESTSSLVQGFHTKTSHLLQQNASPVQHTFRCLQDLLRPLQTKLSLSGHSRLSLRTQASLTSRCIYPSNCREHYNFINRFLQTSHIFPSSSVPFSLSVCPEPTDICPGSSQPSVHGSTPTPSFQLGLGICPFPCHSKLFLPKIKQTPIRSLLSGPQEINPFCQVHAVSLC